MINQERELHAAQLNIVYGQTWTGVLGGIGVALVFVSVLWEVAPHPVLLTWFAVLSAGYLLRAFLYVAYRRRRDNVAIKRWDLAHRAATLLTSATWGLSCFLFVSSTDTFHLLIVVLWMVGLSAASANAYSVHLPTLLTFFLPLVVPVAIHLFAIGGRVQTAVAVGLVAYCLVSLRAVVPINRTMLSSLRLNIALTNEVQQRRKAEDQLREVSRRDCLTGLSNRHHFDESLAAEWRRAQRDARHLSLVLLDIDYFKDFNDTYGHIAGDDCLVTLAHALKNCLKRPGNPAARYGGDELSVLLPNTDSRSASIIAETLRQAVESLAINHGATRVAGQQVVTISAGLATYVPSADAEPPDLIGHADRALYHAKAAGRNRLVINEAMGWQ